MSFISPWMLRNVQDTLLNFTDPGSPVYYRVKNSTEEDKEYLEYGFQISVTGLADAPGYRDIQIDPPASVEAVSMHDIGLNQVALSFGATKFKVSHTFVLRMMQMRGYSDPYEVWNADDLIGLIYNGGLYSIDSLLPETQSGEIICWIIIGNRAEVTVASE